MLLGYHEFTQDDMMTDNKITEQDVQFKKIVTFSSFNSDFECKLEKGSINTSSLPIYTHESDPLTFQPQSYHLRCSLDELIDDSPISSAEFDKIYYELKGSEVNGFACILSDSMISQCLTRIIMTIQALATTAGKDIDDASNYHNIDPRILCERINDDNYSYLVVKTVVRKFSSQDDEQNFSLDEKKVARWYGIEALKIHAKKLVAPNEFLIKWKTSFPQFYNVPIELRWLQGYYAKPLINRIQYFPKDFLSMDAKKRFQELFEVQGTWELEDIEPFIQELNVKKLKIDKFIIKYARKKTEGKKVVVMAR